MTLGRSPENGFAFVHPCTAKERNVLILFRIWDSCAIQYTLADVRHAGDITFHFCTKKLKTVAGYISSQGETIVF